MKTIQRAFTLIELLVVIAIIAILAAILFPVFAQAKRAAKITTSISNMKQIGTATMMYVTDFDDVYYLRRVAGRGPTNLPGDFSWKQLLYPYTKNTQIFTDTLNTAAKYLDDTSDPVLRASWGSNVIGLPDARGYAFFDAPWLFAKSWGASSTSTTAGMIVGEQFWKDGEISRLTDAFLTRIDWNWAMTDGGAHPGERTITMGWKPEGGFLSARWSSFDENKMLYVLAYGLSDIPTDGWAQIKREPVNYKGLDLIRGGPLFMHQMSESFMSFKGVRDGLGYDYSVETRNATLANRQYCIDNPKSMKGYGPNFWGLSACDFPDGYNAFGAPGWINDDGTITPTSAIASLPFTPKESLAAAEALVHDHRSAVGRYGFSNGMNPTRNWNGPDVIGIDLGMMMCGIENYRTGFVNRLSASHPAVKRGMARIGFAPSAAGDSRLIAIKK